MGSTSFSSDGFEPCSPITPEFVKALSNGTMALDCLSVVFHQLSDQAPKCYQGRGLLLLRDGEFQFRIYADKGDNDAKEALDELFQVTRWVPGEEIPKDEYFELWAKDISGYEWTCSKVQVKRHGGVYGLVLTGHMFDVLKNEASSNGPHRRSSLTLHFFEELNVPLNRWMLTRSEVNGQVTQSKNEQVRAEFASSGLRFVVEKTSPEKGSTIVNVFSDDPLPDGLETRVEETLRYVTMRPVRWCLLQRRSSGSLLVSLVPTKKCGKPLFDEPLDPRPYLADDYWSLFVAFFEYVSQHPNPTDYHPLSVQLFHLTEGETRQLDSVGLMVSVAVEGVLKCLYSNIGAPSDAFLLEVERIREEIKKMTFNDEALRGRLDGALNAMKSIRPGDQMKELVEQGVITAPQQKTWTKLRNSSAHAAAKFDPDSINKLWAECMTVYTLLNRLIFNAIGYKGQFCDYGTRGWPIAHLLPPTATPDSLDSPGPLELPQE